MLGTFHFIRPWWWLALIPALLIAILWYKKSQAGNNVWKEHCDPHLLEYILVSSPSARSIWLIALLGVAWFLTVFALSGPSWSRYAAPVYQKNIARVIVLDVSQSMNATDITPSRMQRAKYKVLDLLHAIKEGQTGMVVFSSSAFVVSPLTADSNTIASMVPVLDSNIVPVQGSDIAAGLTKAGELFKQSGSTRGEIILITDSSPSASALTEASNLAKQGFVTSVLAIGTKEGTPAKGNDGNFATDANGNVSLAHLDVNGLENLAKTGSGEYVAFKGDNSDVDSLLKVAALNGLDAKASAESQTESLWQDRGDYLIWGTLILFALLARRGWLEKLC